jgi:uncharacterized protein
LLEAVALFGLLPALVALGPRWLVSVWIVSAALVAVWVLRLDPAFPKAGFWGLEAARPYLMSVLARSLLGGLVLGLGLWHFSPTPFLVTTQPGLWLLVMIFYPVSAYAQELASRTFFFHRYSTLLPTSRARIVASGLAFGWAHIAVNNWTGMLLSSFAGLIFAWTYERSRSTWLVALEHALYGNFAFTAGLASLFYSSERWVHW